MPPKQPFFLRFAPEVVGHLDWIERKYHNLIRQTIREQLGHAPGIETRNRKTLDQPAPYGATWELRFGPNNRFRVLYEIDTEQQEVWILAIGIKEGNRLFIGGEEYLG
jgi:mRNA-degrading endonuclease RelE of RelBE toxin-antitoxin system